MSRRPAFILAALLGCAGSVLAQAQAQAQAEPASQAELPAPAPAVPAASPQDAPVQPAAPAQHAALAEPAAQSEAAAQGEQAGHAAGGGHEAPLSAGEIFLQLYKHLEPHAVAALWVGGQRGFGFVPPYPTDAQGQPRALDAHHHPVAFHSSAELSAYGKTLYGGGRGVLIYNVNTVQWIAALLVLVIFVSLARGAVRRRDGAPTGGVYNMFESLVLYVRDDMVYNVMGAEVGRRFLPLFLTQFVFILMMNLLGLIWLPWGIGGTATANLAVTGGLALTTLIWIVGAGMREHGPLGYWKTYAPHGLPLFVLPLFAVIELASNLVIKPAALTIRLFANMTAGHLVVLSLFGLIYLAGTLGFGGPSLLAFGFAVGINLLEVMVAFIQAYIFTYLSIVFVGASVHPEH